MTREVFQELDFQATPMGELVLRRTHPPSLDGEAVYEVTLDGEFLMSSLVTDSERALARRTLGLFGARPARVLVGGLGLGYTAAAALEFDFVTELVVLEAHAHVIRWHHDRLVPASASLAADPRCSFVEQDFFAWARDADVTPAGRFDAILVDIDHSPDEPLDPSHADLYTTAGLRRLASRLSPGGVFGLWSAEPPDPAFVARLSKVFTDAVGLVETFRNPLIDAEDANTIYVAHAAGS